MTEQTEKVCKALEIEIEHLKYKSSFASALEMPSIENRYEKQADVCRDVLALIRQQQERIKELEAGQKQEPVLLENQHKPYGHFINANSPWISRCPKCGKKVEGKQTRYCKYCGQAVKWE